MSRLWNILKEIVKSRQNPIYQSWSTTSYTTGAVNNMVTITIPANSMYLVFAKGGNGDGSKQICNIDLTQSGASVFYKANSSNDSGGGNASLGIAYIATGDTPATLTATQYGYVAGKTLNGIICAVPIWGGYKLTNLLHISERGCVA